MKHLKIKVTGRVQGVGFRNAAKHRADQLELKGFARNEEDGTVYIEVEGGEEKLQKFLEWCQEGSDAANVESVESEVHSPEYHEGFAKY